MGTDTPLVPDLSSAHYACVQNADCYQRGNYWDLLTPADLIPVLPSLQYLAGLASLFLVFWRDLPRHELRI